MSTRVFALDASAAAPFLQATDGDPQQTLDALLKAALRDTWRGPGGQMFINLRADLSLPDDAPAAREAWRKLVAVVRPRTFTGPDWLRRLDAHDKNLTSPADAGALVSLLDCEPSALETIVEACREAGRDGEGDALEGLVHFLRKASHAGWWVLGVEQT
jgi:hypothetical protein